MVAESKEDSRIDIKEPKIGVYICHCGGNISDEVDVEAVKKAVSKLPNVAVAHTNMFMCSDPGQDLIMEDIKSGKINRVVVASCAPSLHEMTFRSAISRAGLNPYLYEHANVREQVSWVHHGEEATDKALKLVAAAVAKARKLSPLEPIKVDAKAHATVIGGGIAGLKAAKDIASCGIDVTLIERSPFLGGNSTRLDKLFPTEEKVETLLSELSKEVMEDDRITILTCAEVIESEGYVGNFRLKVKVRPPLNQEDIEKIAIINEKGIKPGDAYIPFVGIYPKEVAKEENEIEIPTGVIVLATGFRHYIPKKGEYGYGEIEEVITLPDLIRIMAESNDKGYLKINGRIIRRIVMIHCVGSRQIPGIHEPKEEGGRLNEYCSRVCCTATLQAANELRERFPETRVFDIYRDIRTYGRGHEDYYEEASSKEVLFFRFEPQDPPEVTRSSETDEYPISVKVKDVLTFGEEIEIPTDLVVLAVGMEPNEISSLVEMLKLPVGSDGFLLEVHPKLRPVELAVSGVLIAGTCQAPMDITETTAAAGAASVKATSILTRGYVELDPFVAEVDPSKCKGTGYCIEACVQEGAIFMEEIEIEGEKKKQARINPALCKGCGICVAVCPERAIDIKGWRLEQYEAMVDAIVEDIAVGGAS